MKPIVILALSGLLFTACKKEDQHPDGAQFFELIKKSLKDSLNTERYIALDFSRALISQIPEQERYYLRIPFKNSAFENGFLALQSNSNGGIQGGKFFHLEGFIANDAKDANKEFDGKLTITSLGGVEILSSKISKGYVEAFHGHLKGDEGMKILPGDAPSKVLPEVVVVAYIGGSGSSSLSTWIALKSFFENSGGGGNTGYYWPVEGSGGGSSGGYYSGGSPTGGKTSVPTNGGVTQEEVLTVDVESQDGLDPIGIESFLKCFSTIPDEGSQSEIEIFTDIPVDGNPYRIFNFNSGSPGHTFLCITKQNGRQRVSQYIGFYPKKGWKTMLTNAPMEGKFVNNEYHEFNARFKMSIASAQLTSILTELLYLKNQKYDIDNFNCTDWALDIFNKVRGEKVEIPLFDLPGNVPSTGTRTPQGLYIKLKQMFDSNHPEKANITMNIVKGWAGGSTGPCN